MIVGSPTKLNLIPSGVMPVVYINQGDAGYDKEFLVYNGNSPYNVPAGVSATIRGKKADGYGVTEAAALTEGSNLVTVTITEQMVAAAGANLYELVFVDTDDLRIATINMVWAVKADALGDAAISDSDLDYATTVMNQLQSVQAFKNQLDTNIEGLAAETAARIAADDTERAARIAADNTLQNNINSEALARSTTDASLQSQINQLVAPTGSAPSAAEVENARIAANGSTYSTLGDAIRSQILDLEPLKKLYVNLVNPDTVVSLGLSYYVAGQYFSTSTTSKIIALPCKPNTKYTIIQTKTSGRFVVMTSSSYPANRVSYNSITSGFTSPKQITTGASDAFIAVKYYDSGVDSTYTAAQHLASLMVAEGDFADFYEWGDIDYKLNSYVYDAVEPLTKLYANLVNPEDADIKDLYMIGNTQKFGQSTTSRVVVVPCKPSTKYTVMQTLTSGRFAAVSGATYPAVNVSYNTEAGGTLYESPKVFTTGANDVWLAVRFYDSGVDTTYTMEQHLASLMVAEGEIDTFYAWGKIQIAPELLSEKTYDTIDARTGALISEALDSLGTDVYGIRINTDGSVNRVANAVGKVNDYVIGSSFAGDGTNDFDSIYPWSEIKTCNIDTNTDGETVITYEGQADFSRTGTNGSVYVEIPKFYTKRYRDDNGNEVILISGTRHGGFVVEPAFYDSVTGEEIEHIYVGAYLTQTGVNVMNSLSGVFPESDVSLDTFRSRTGEVYDFVTLQALQKLMSIEFGAVNLSSIFGGFSYLPWSSSCKAETAATSVNTGNFKGDTRINNIGVGSTITVSTSTGQVQNRTVTAITDATYSDGTYHRTITFDGSPVDLAANTTLLYCSGQKTGFTDSLAYHTGRTNLNSGNTYSNQFRYRGVEGLWGTLGEIMDGVIVKDLKAYWSNIKTDYGDVTKYKRLNFHVPLQNTYTNSQNPLPPQIKEMGWDFRYPTIAMPEVLAAKSEQYYGDLFFSIEDTGPDGQTYPTGTEFIGISSMAWDGHEDNGLYTLRFWNKADGHAWLYGSRAIIRHLT